MKQRRIFAQLVNQWQEETKEDFKAQKRRLRMQKKAGCSAPFWATARNGKQKSPERKGGAGCSALKWAAAHQNLPSSKNARCSALEGLQRTQNVPRGWTRAAACPTDAAACQKGPGMCATRCSAPKCAAARLSPLRTKSLFKKCALQRVFTWAAARN